MGLRHWDTPRHAQVRGEAVVTQKMELSPIAAGILAFQEGPQWWKTTQAADKAVASPPNLLLCSLELQESWAPLTYSEPSVGA